MLRKNPSIVIVHFFHQLWKIVAICLLWNQDNFDIVLKLITNRFSERQTQYEPNKAISDNFQHSIKIKSKFQTEHRNILILTLLLVSNYLGSRADKLQRFFKVDEKYAQSLSLLKDFSLTAGIFWTYSNCRSLKLIPPIFAKIDKGGPC